MSSWRSKKNVLTSYWTAPSAGASPLLSILGIKNSRITYNIGRAHCLQEACAIWIVRQLWRPFAPQWWDGAEDEANFCGTSDHDVCRSRRRRLWAAPRTTGYRLCDLEALWPSKTTWVWTKGSPTITLLILFLRRSIIGAHLIRNVEAINFSRTMSSHQVDVLSRCAQRTERCDNKDSQLGRARSPAPTATLEAERAHIDIKSNPRIQQLLLRLFIHMGLGDAYPQGQNLTRTLNHQCQHPAPVSAMWASFKCNPHTPPASRP